MIYFTFLPSACISLISDIKSAFDVPAVSRLNTTVISVSDTGSANATLITLYSDGTSPYSDISIIIPILPITNNCFIGHSRIFLLPM